MCQQTGKGERNVTVYGIAGDGVTEFWTYQRVKTKYPEKIKERREKEQERAWNVHTVQTEKDYKEDISRGLSLTQNVINHALYLEYLIGEMESKIGREEYKWWLKKTLEMLKKFDNQGSTARYSVQLNDFTKALRKDTQKSACEIEMGVSVTLLMRGDVA